MLKKTNTLICFSLNRLLKTCVLYCAYAVFALVCVCVCMCEWVFLSFLVYLYFCLFVYRLDFVFFLVCSVCAWLRVYFFVTFFFLIIMSNALTKMLIFMYITWYTVFSLSRFRFNFWFDDAVETRRNHINITHRRDAHVFSLYLQSGKHHLYVIYIQMYLYILYHSPSLTPPFIPFSFNTLFYILCTIIRSRCIILLTVCICFFYLRFRFVSILLWICLNLFRYTIFLCSYWNFKYKPFRTFFFSPCVVFSHNITIEHV